MRFHVSGGAFISRVALKNGCAKRRAYLVNEIRVSGDAFITYGNGGMGAGNSSRNW